MFHCYSTPIIKETRAKIVTQIPGIFCIRGGIPKFVHHVIFLYILSTYITLYTQNQLI